MGGFIGGDAAVSEELEDALCRAEHMPDTAWWEEQAASFRPEEAKGVPLSVTVDADASAQPYGDRPGFFRRLLRRLLRKCMRWYVEPVVQQQNAVNRELLRELEAQKKRLDELEEQRKP